MTIKSKTILFATDFSSASEEAFEHALDLAKTNHAELFLLHVIQPEEVLEPGFSTSLEQKNEELLNELLAIAKQNEVSTEIKLTTGIPSEIIIKTADELNCGLIVLGTHGRTGLTRLLMGSTAEMVLRKSNKTVLVVKSAHPISAE